MKEKYKLQTQNRAETALHNSEECWSGLLDIISLIFFEWEPYKPRVQSKSSVVWTTKMTSRF